jgi:non-homologous end joining protein Ku
LMAHLKAKQAGMPPQPKQSWTVPRRAINLMEALRRSIAADKKYDFYPAISTACMVHVAPVSRVHG